MIKWIYGYGYSDVMTGYRAMSKPFVKTFPVLSEGFQIETELSIHAVDHRWRILNVPIDYRDRPAGSVSKLDTLGDGLKVVAMVGALFKDYRPLKFFSLVALAFFCRGAGFGHSHRPRVHFDRSRTPFPDRDPRGRTDVSLRTVPSYRFCFGCGGEVGSQAMGTCGLSGLPTFE